ncbi:MAG TPA: hypothetical protein VLK23_09350 [Thermodesulfobacteriota bacterium]|nr:hypothetical protein [Thermodesulfobacteriota bacterium]
MKAKSKTMKFLAVGLLFLVIGFFSSEAFPWGFATHTYINDHLGKTKRNQNMDEIYGGVAPDTFNYLFNFPDYLGFLSDQTHTEYTKVWDVPKAGLGKSLAFGFATHNDVWGADSTAHHSGRTLGQNEGYIIAKANLLAAILKQVPDYAALGLPDPVTLEISHELLENGVDLLIKRIDPLIGQKLSSSAVFRTSDFPVLLVKAYARDFSQFAGISYHEASKFITSAEKEFRKSIILYGQALMQDEATAIQLISEGTADIAAGFLAANGITPPPSEAIVPLIAFAIEQSIELCADDFADEITATIDFVGQNLAVHGISY